MTVYWATVLSLSVVCISQAGPSKLGRWWGMAGFACCGHIFAISLACIIIENI